MEKAVKLQKNNDKEKIEMAFKNEYLTEEEKQMITEAKILDPRYSIAVKKYLNPRNWIIDRERNIALIYCGELDREEYYKKVFALLYKEFDNEHLIRFVLVRKRFDKAITTELEKKYEVDGVEKWVLNEKKVPSFLRIEIDDTEAYKLLIEALSVYGIDGRNDQDYTIKAFLEVGGEIIS